MSPILKQDKLYTYQDYLTWPNEERWEIIGGEAYNMTPAPTTRHQRIAGRLYSRLERLFENGQCSVFASPIDVVLSEYDVVQPDIIVVCDEKKITEKNIQGAPDLVVEILSPYTALKDKREKKALYERSGIKEYIIVDPVEEYVERFYIKQDGLYVMPEIFGPQEKMSIRILEGIEIMLWEVFEKEPPEEAD